MAAKVWTRSEIEGLIKDNDLAVERGIVAIFNRQTGDEKQDGTVNHHNRQGFSGNNSKRGTYYAKWLLSGRHLNGTHLQKARRICLHHAGQLTNIANGKL